MSKERRSTIKKNDKEQGHLRGPHGYRLCRFCKKEVAPPRKTFCSDLCVHNWRMRSDTGYLRKLVYERDLGQCATCKIDTRYTRIEIENAAREAMMKNGVWFCDNDPDYLSVLHKHNLTAKEAKKSLWQADHIVEVADGGGESDLSNFQTLCTKDHKIKSAESRRKRAARLKEFKKTRPVILFVACHKGQ